MPVTTRPRKLRKGFWAGSTTTRKPRAKRTRKPTTRAGLNTVEKKAGKADNCR